MAARYALPVDEGANLQQMLSALHISLDDPEERAAVDEIADACRRHPCGVKVLDRLSRPTPT